MKQRSRLPARAWSSTAISLTLSAAILLQSCGMGTDIDNENTRKAMKQEILNSLTNNDCPNAVMLSTKLYNSKYSDNEIRNLHASALACGAGIRFYDMLDQISSNDFSSVTAIFKSLVKMFPSRTALDSKLQNALYAQDALQSMWNPGTVAAPADLFYSTTFNPGSARPIDRTIGSNVFLIFVAMGELGSALNRYGFNASDDPASTAYVKTIPLPWTTLVDVQSDTTGSACGIASALYNLIDAINSSSGILPSSISGSMGSVLAVLIANLDVAARLQCTVTNGFSPANCDAGILRLRYRNACSEQGPSASAAAGIIQAINAGWI